MPNCTKLVASMRVAYSPVALAAACLFTTLPAFAYEQLTHQLLTGLAYDRSSVTGMNSYLLIDFGLPDPSAAQFSENQLGTVNDVGPDGKRLLYVPHPGHPVSARELMAWGAFYEDSIFKSVAFDHFWDPQFNGGQGRGLYVAGVVPQLLGGGNASPDWVLEDNGRDFVDNNSDSVGHVHGYSARIAAQNYYLALTAGNPASRLTAASLMWQSLGHVAHHIEDMAQPQHTRNEPHLHGDHVFPLPGNREFPPGISRYEMSTKDRFPTETELSQLVNDPANRFPPTAGPMFSRTRDYFEMGQFTSKNFTTPMSEFSIVPTGTGYGPNADFPLPDGSNVTGLVAETAPDTFLGFHYKTYYLHETIPDIRGSGPSLNIRMARACNLFQMFRAQTGDNKAPCLVPDDNVYDDWNRVLLPRAVSYVAGMIDHFFRARLTLTAVAAANGQIDGTTWQIKETAHHFLTGKWELYKEDSAGVRTLIWSKVQGIAANDSFKVTLPTSPAPAPMLVAVFSGMIDSEGDQTGSNGYYQVAGARMSVPAPVTPPPPPPPPAPSPPPGTCLVPPQYIANTPTTVDLGTAKGLVTWTQTATGLPIALKITEGSSVLVNVPPANEFTGEQTFKFQYNGTPLTVNLQVDPMWYPAQITPKWDYAVTCPGTSTVKKAITTKPVRFAVVGNKCNAGWSLTVDEVLHGGEGTYNLWVGSGHTVGFKVQGTNLCSLGAGGIYWGDLFIDTGDGKGLHAILSGLSDNGAYFDVN